MTDDNAALAPEVEAFQQGQLLAYPTEAVYGLGCDPDNEAAVMALLALKQRPVSKGLILIASTYSQLLPYVNDQRIPMDKRTEIFSSWPGAVTWLLPKSEHAPEWITGDSELIAVRVTNHAGVKALCEMLGKPLVSTSANISGREPAMSADEIHQQFGDKVLLVDGELGGNTSPSQIRHGFTGEVIRT